MNGRCENHPLELATNVCNSCYGEFCSDCYTQPKRRKHPLCTDCVLIASGVRSRKYLEIKGEKKTAKKRRQEITARSDELPGTFNFFDAETSADEAAVAVGATLADGEAAVMAAPSDPMAAAPPAPASGGATDDAGMPPPPPPAAPATSKNKAPRRSAIAKLELLRKGGQGPAPADVPADPPAAPPPAVGPEGDDHVNIGIADRIEGHSDLGRLDRRDPSLDVLPRAPHSPAGIGDTPAPPGPDAPSAANQAAPPAPAAPPPEGWAPQATPAPTPARAASPADAAPQAGPAAMAAPADVEAPEPTPPAPAAGSSAPAIDWSAPVDWSNPLAPTGTASAAPDAPVSGDAPSSAPEAPQPATTVDQAPPPHAGGQPWPTPAPDHSVPQAAPATHVAPAPPAAPAPASPPTSAAVADERFGQFAALATSDDAGDRTHPQPGPGNHPAPPAQGQPTPGPTQASPGVADNAFLNGESTVPGAAPEWSAPATPAPSTPAPSTPAPSATAPSTPAPVADHGHQSASPADPAPGAPSPWATTPVEAPGPWSGQPAVDTPTPGPQGYDHTTWAQPATSAVDPTPTVHERPPATVAYDQADGPTGADDEPVPDDEDDAPFAALRRRRTDNPTSTPQTAPMIGEIRTIGGRRQSDRHEPSVPAAVIEEHTVAPQGVDQFDANRGHGVPAPEAGVANPEFHDTAVPALHEPPQAMPTSAPAPAAAFGAAPGTVAAAPPVPASADPDAVVPPPGWGAPDPAPTGPVPHPDQGPADGVPDALRPATEATAPPAASGDETDANGNWVPPILRGG
ncbi:MAG: hypothetical protein AAGD35_21625 [Actinomycetota bacterium]